MYKTATPLLVRIVPYSGKFSREEAFHGSVLSEHFAEKNVSQSLAVVAGLKICGETFMDGFQIAKLVKPPSPLESFPLYGLHNTCVVLVQARLNWIKLTL